jgi:membrane fusion protein, heavy metal efflux system
LKLGQIAHITLTNEIKERIAKVYLIGKEISPGRTIRVHCHLEGEDSDLIPGTYFSAVIETGSNLVNALPESAIVNFDGKHFVFVEADATKHLYKLLEVNTGASDSGYVEVSFNANDLSDYKNKIVIAGSFELLNTLKNVEE